MYRTSSHIQAWILNKSYYMPENVDLQNVINVAEFIKILPDCNNGNYYCPNMKCPHFNLNEFSYPHSESIRLFITETNKTPFKNICDNCSSKQEKGVQNNMSIFQSPGVLFWSPSSDFD